MGKNSLLKHLVDEDKIYKKCLKKTLNHYKLRKNEVDSCSYNIYHELSKHAHGNTNELLISDKEHTITEVCAMETIFCALKEQGCFTMELNLFVK